VAVCAAAQRRSARLAQSCAAQRWQNGQQGGLWSCLVQHQEVGVSFVSSCRVGATLM